MADTAASPPPSANPRAVGLGVLEYWKGINLDSKRSELDQQGLEIADNQEASLKSRKRLAEQTKGFAKFPDDQKLKELRPLLKSYQEEVDRLTVRAKSSENAFLSLYKLLYEAPDPVPTLAAALEDSSKTAELEAQNRRMRQELDEYKNEFSMLKNQEVTIRRLEEKCRALETQMEAKVQEQVEQRERAAKEEAARQAEAFAERERDLQRAVHQANESAAEASRARDAVQDQLFDLRTRLEEMSAAKQAEVDMMASEIERASSKLVSLERDRMDLRSQVDALKKRLQNEGRGPSNAEGGRDWELEASQKESYIGQLSDHLRSLQVTAEQERQRHAAELQGVREAIGQKEAAIRELQRELAARPTAKQLEQLKQQLRIMQAVEFNHIEGEGEEGAAAAASDLEAALMAKNRTLEATATKLKVRAQDAESELEAKTRALETLTREAAEQKALIARLEEDLLRAAAAGEGEGGNETPSAAGAGARAPSVGPAAPSSFHSSPEQHAGGAPRSGSVAGAVAARLAAVAAAEAAAAAGGTGGSRPKNDDLGDLWGAEEPELVDPLSRPMTPAPGTAGAGAGSMLDIIRSQRDRFRKRMQELEIDNQRMKRQLDAAVAEAQQLKQDNVALYEKIRYVQSYPDLAAAGGAQKNRQLPKRRQADIESGDVEGRYKALYDEKYNPFAAFSQKQRQDAVKQLSVPERLTLRGSEFFLRNKVFRTFLFFYSLALHLLVFTTLYRLSTYSCEGVLAATHGTGPPVPNHSRSLLQFDPTS
eukprot:tig00000157_g9603.t1